MDKVACWLLTASQLAHRHSKVLCPARTIPQPTRRPCPAPPLAPSPALDDDMPVCFGEGGVPPRGLMTIICRAACKPGQIWNDGLACPARFNRLHAVAQPKGAAKDGRPPPSTAFGMVQLSTSHTFCTTQVRTGWRTPHSDPLRSHPHAPPPPSPPLETTPQGRAPGAP